MRGESESESFVASQPGASLLITRSNRKIQLSDSAQNGLFSIKKYKQRVYCTGSCVLEKERH